MTRNYLMLILLFSVTTANAQREFTGRVVDAATGNGLAFASLRVTDRAEGGITDLDGNFSFTISQFPARIIVSSIGYRSDTVLVNTADFLAVHLQTTSANLPGVEVVGQRQWTMLKRPKVLPQSLVIHRGKLLVLGRRSRRTYLTMYSPAGDLLVEREMKVPGISGLAVNCFGELHLFTRELAILLDDGKLSPLEKMPLADYRQLYQDCRFSNKERLFLVRTDFEGFRKLYLAGDRASGELHLYKSIWQKAKIRSFRMAVPRLDYLASGQHNMGDINYAENKRIRRSQGDADFEKAIIQKNHTHNALFFREETLTLFNFDEDVIETFSAAGDSLSTVPILFNAERKGADAVMRQDPITGKYYSIRRLKAGYILTEIDASTGRGVHDMLLEIVDYRQLVILGGRVYLIGIPLRNQALAEWELIWMGVG